MPTYPAYSTLEDNKEYVEVFLDKDTKLQQTVTKIVADMALQLADTAILPFDVQNYAQVFDRGKKFLREKASVMKSADVDLGKCSESEYTGFVSLYFVIYYVGISREIVLFPKYSVFLGTSCAVFTRFVSLYLSNLIC